MAQIASIQAEIGENGSAQRTLQAALRVADRLRDGHESYEKDRSWAMSSIAPVFVEIGDVAKALDIANSILDDRNRAEAIGSIAETLGKVAGRQ